MLMANLFVVILGTNRGREVVRYFDDLADARARVQAEAFDNGDIRESDNSIDYGSNANRMIDSLPSEVISGQATLRTRFGDEYRKLSTAHGRSRTTIVNLRFT
jgi:hypothetical protein